MKVVNLLLPAVNVITSKTVGKYVKNQDVKINTICSVVRQNTYAIDKQNQYSRKENIRITGRPENDDVDDFDTFKQLCGKMGIEVNKEDIVACHRVGDPGKKKPRTLIVRFVSTDLKLKKIANKKKLQDCPELKKVYFNEDLTVLRLKLLQYAKNIDNVVSRYKKRENPLCYEKWENMTVDNTDDLFHLGVTDIDYGEFGLPII